MIRFNGIAEDKDTRRVLGIDVPRYKLAAFCDRYRINRARKGRKQS